MGAIMDLWRSERGLVAVLLIVACTVLAVQGKLTVAEWTDYSKWIFVTYAAAKTITGTAQVLKGPQVTEDTATGSGPPSVPPPVLSRGTPPP